MQDRPVELWVGIGLLKKQVFREKQISRKSQRILFVHASLAESHKYHQNSLFGPRQQRCSAGSRGSRTCSTPSRLPGQQPNQTWPFGSAPGASWLSAHAAFAASSACVAGLGSAGTPSGAPSSFAPTLTGSSASSACAAHSTQRCCVSARMPTASRTKHHLGVTPMCKSRLRAYKMVPASVSI